MKKFIPKVFVLTALLMISTFLFSPFLRINLSADNLGEVNVFFERMKTDVETSMTVMFTPSTDFDSSEDDRVFKIYFPEGEVGDGEWCLDHIDGELSVTGVDSSVVEVGDWEIDEVLPGSLTAFCYQGEGVNGRDYIEIGGIDNLVANTTYGFKIDADGDVFKTGSSAGSNLLSLQLVEGMKVETVSFYINLLGVDQVLIEALVSGADTITCTIGGNVNLGTLFLGGAYVTGNHSLTTESAGTGFYWAVSGQEGGLAHTTDLEAPVISSEGVDGIVDLVNGQGFGLVVSSSSLGDVQPNYMPSTPGEFGAIDTEGTLILYSDTSGSGEYTITLGARAGLGTVTGVYEEVLTYVCGGYIGEVVE